MTTPLPTPDDPDRGLVLRGLLLVGLLTAIAGAVLFMILRQPQQTVPEGLSRPEPMVAALVAGSPWAVNWSIVPSLVDELPSSPGWDARYQATRSLARLGSDKIPWPILAEMLDERRQMRNFRVALADGRVVPNESEARQVVLIGLKALGEWHAARKPVSVPPEIRATVYAQVDALADSPIAELRKEALATQRTFVR